MHTLYGRVSERNQITDHHHLSCNTRSRTQFVPRVDTSTSHKMPPDELTAATWVPVEGSSTEAVASDGTHQTTVLTEEARLCEAHGSAATWTYHVHNRSTSREMISKNNILA